MADGEDRYEIFIKAVAGFVDSDLTATVWSWRRLNAEGRIVADGGGHPSLEASFASVGRHAASFGAAPVKINLHEPDQPGPPVATPIHGAVINALDRERKWRNGRAAGPLPPAPPRLPVPIAVRTPTRGLAVQRWVHPASLRQTRRS